jgi:hypothetical protein
VSSFDAARGACTLCALSMLAGMTLLTIGSEVCRFVQLAMSASTQCLPARSRRKDNQVAAAPPG